MIKRFLIGALISVVFLGAYTTEIDPTFASASAVFRPDMVVAKGVVKALIVTGTINPDPTGLVADIESSEIVKRTVEKKYNETVDGRINQFTYGQVDLDNHMESTASGGGDGEGV